MAAYNLPTDTGPNTQPQVLRTTLDGQVFQIYIRYNSRAGMWRMDLQDDAGTTLAAGLSLRNAGIPANGCIINLQGFPAGLLLAVPVTDAKTDANLEELGARVLLMYQQLQAV